MKILFIGDIFGTAGIDMVERHVANLKREHKVQLTIANAENCSYLGKGISLRDYKRILKSGVDLCTMGNHTFDNAELIDRNEEFGKLIRPANIQTEQAYGNGFKIININGVKVLVINLLGTVFMKKVDSPFKAVDEILDLYPEVTTVFVDFHAETTSEKIAMGRYLTGRVTAVVGTHTHVPTADAQIFDKYTAYLTDCGMTGPENGIIGMDANQVISGFVQDRFVKCDVAHDGRNQLNACLITTNPEGQANKIEQIKIIE